MSEAGNGEWAVGNGEEAVVFGAFAGLGSSVDADGAVVGAGLDFGDIRDSSVNGAA